MANETKKKAGLPVVHCIITVAIMIVFSLFPGVGSITPYGMKIIGILIGIVYGMSTVDIFFPAVCGILAMGIASGNLNGVLASALGSNLVWGVIMTLTILYAMQHEKVTTFFANWIISRKVLKGRPWLYSFAILIGTSILALVSPVASMLIFWEIIYAACDCVGYERNCKWSQAMIVGTCFAAGTGILYLPVIQNGMVARNIFLANTESLGIAFDTGKYIATAVPLILCGIGLFILMNKLIFRIDVSALKNLDDSVIDKEALKLNNRQRFIIFCVIALIAVLLAAAFLPATLAPVALVKNIDLFGCAAVVVLLFCTVRIDGRPIFTIQEAASNGVVWSMVFMVALIAPLGSALTSSDAGITAALSSTLGPVLQGKPDWLFVLILVVVGAVLTNLAQNLVILSTILPLVVALSGTMNFNVSAVFILIMLATHYAIVLPSACPAAGLMFSNPNLKPAFAYKHGLCIMVIAIAFLMTVGYFWVNLIY